MSLYKDKDFGYDVTKHGAIVAIRIFYGENNTPMAELKTAYATDKFPDRKVTICWVAVNQRTQFMLGINGYTLFYDEREKESFDTVYGQ